MSFRFRDLLSNLSPRWLRGEWGTRLVQGGIGLTADSIAEAAVIAFRSGLILSDACLDDALGALGGERGLRRFAADTTRTYRARVWRAWEAYAKAGTASAIISQLEAFGLAPQTSEWEDGGASVLAPQAARAFIQSGLTLSGDTVSAPDGSTAVRFYENGVGSIAHGISAYADAPTLSQALTVEFDVRLVGRDWVRMAITGDSVRSTDVFINPATRAVVVPGDPCVAFVRPLSADWYRIRVGFQRLADTRFTVEIGTAESSVSTNHVADPSAGIELRDASPRLSTWALDIYTPRQWTRDDRLHPVTSDEWWSQFWVFVDWGTHQGALTTDQKSALVEIVKKWKPSRWHCAVIILGGSGAVVGTGITTGSFTVGGTPEEILSVS